jgi:hypothetical protein
MKKVLWAIISSLALKSCVVCANSEDIPDDSHVGPQLSVTDAARMLSQGLYTHDNECARDPDLQRKVQFTHVVTALGTAGSTARIMIYGSSRSWGMAASILSTLSKVHLVVVTPCTEAHDLVFFESMVSELGFQNIELQCGLDSYDPNAEFDVTIIDDGFTYSEGLLALFRARTLTVSAGLVIFASCDSCGAWNKQSFSACQVWNHAESFGLVEKVFTAGISLGHFSAKSLPPDDSVKLSFIKPKHRDEYYELPISQTIKIDVKVSSGDAANAFRTAPDIWFLCYQATLKFPALPVDAGVRTMQEPLCLPLLNAKLPDLPLESPLSTAVSNQTWVFAAWLQISSTANSLDAGRVHTTKIASTTIEVVYGASQISRVQAFTKRLKSGILHRPTDTIEKTRGGALEGKVCNTPEVPEKKKRRWAFMSSCSRGTGISMFNYAKNMEDLLDQESALVLCAPPRDFGLESVIRERFGRRIHLLDRWPTPQELDPLLLLHNVTDLYVRKMGNRDGVLSQLPGVRTCIHCVFCAHEPHGTVYAKLSNAVPGNAPIIPSMIDFPEVTGNLREDLGIPTAAVVFGRYGGHDTFDIPFVHSVVETISKHRLDVYFIFMNTPVFCCSSHPNVIFLQPTSNFTQRVRFIQTCDAMLHARQLGETFGNAVAEFSTKGKPVLTFGGAHDQSHLEILGEYALIYYDYQSLYNLIEEFNCTDIVKLNWNRYGGYSPAAVMQTFVRVFW